jgi:hypothetical protein
MGTIFYCCRRKQRALPLSPLELQRISNKIITRSQLDSDSYQNVIILQNQLNLQTRKSLKLFFKKILGYNRAAKKDDSISYLYYFTDQNIYYCNVGRNTPVFEFYFVKDIELSQDKLFYLHPTLDLNTINVAQKRNRYLNWSLVVFILIYFYNTKEYLIRDFHRSCSESNSIPENIDINLTFEISMEESVMEMVKILLDPRNEDEGVFEEA